LAKEISAAFLLHMTGNRALFTAEKNTTKVTGKKNKSPLPCQSLTIIAFDND
jgi:hypothetical protein